MRLILEFRSGPAKVPRIWLLNGQTATIGRTESADICVAGDHQMSALHFSLVCRAQGCVLRDLDSTNGTRVNGAVVREAILRGGDVIRAGQTEFAVHVRQDVCDEPKVPQAFDATPGVAQSVLLRGRQPAPSRRQVLETLGAKLPVRLLVNCVALDRPLPPNPVFLLNWLPASVIARLSPVVICPARLDDAREWIDSAWGKDALVTLFSRLETTEFVRHIRRLARGHCHPAAIPNIDLMLAGSAPREWRARLTAAPESYVRFALSGLDAVMFEPEDDAHWDLFSSTSIADWLAEQTKCAAETSAESSVPVRRE